VRDLLDVDGPDPIDSALGSGARVQRGGWAWHRPALGLGASPVPMFAVLLTGVMLGHQGLGILTPAVLHAVEPVTAAATVALGVLIGLDTDVLRRPGTSRLLAGATIESGITLLVVAAAFVLITRLPGWEWAAGSHVALLFGVVAASSAIRTHAGGDDSVLARLGDLDDLLPIAAGAVLLAGAAVDSLSNSLVLLGAAVVLIVTLAVAGSLLVSGSSTDGEQRVYATATVLLLTGLAASLSASTLFAGTLAAAAWSLSKAAGREALARDIRYLQHPIVVLVLVVAGAQASTSMPVIVLGVLFALVRLAGKVAGGALAAPLVPALDRRMGLRLVAPGAAGVAAALMVVHATGITTAVEPLLGVAVWGAILSDFLALLVAPRGAGA
jgi:hypothetical protein